MNDSVIIAFCIAALVAWIVWLAYNYAVFKKTMVIEHNKDKYKTRCNRLVDCIEFLVKDINTKLPGSTLKYTYVDDIDSIEGKIVYNTQCEQQ